MSMTAEEKKELVEKFTKEELVDLMDSMRDDAAAKREADKKALIDKFFGTGKREETPAEEDDEPVRLEDDKYFKSLLATFN